jgi:hypothetical protein
MIRDRAPPGRVCMLELQLKEGIAAKDAEITALKQVAELSSALAAARTPQKTYSSASATNGGDSSLLSSMAAEVERLQEELDEAKEKLDEEKFTHEQTAKVSQQHVEVGGKGYWVLGTCALGHVRACLALVFGLVPTLYAT